MMNWASLVSQRLKRLPAMWETWVRSLGREDSLEKELATHSSILDWRIPWTEEPWWATVHRVAKSQTRLSDFTFTFLKNYVHVCSVIRLCPTVQPHRVQPAMLLCPWNFPGKSTGAGCHFLLQGIFLTQGLNPGLPHCGQML